MNRRDFLRGGAGLMAVAAMPGNSDAGTASAFSKAEKLGPVLTDVELRTGRIRGKTAAFYIDDVIWTLRDLTRQRPKSLLELPFLAHLRECHEKWGLKVQLNLFYRTDFYYGRDEFSLADVTADYKSEWQANKDWLRLGFHSLQEFPDYPFVSADYEDVKFVFDRIRNEVDRFAGTGVFTYATVPHWFPTSKEGCRALKDCGVRVIACSCGPRYRYDGNREMLPYGHGMRAENNRKPETAMYWREGQGDAISVSLCGYNHLSDAQFEQTCGTYAYLHDNDTGANFKQFTCGPCLNLSTVEGLPAECKPNLDKEFFAFATHEQYFYREYFAYQSDYAEKTRVISRILKESGYSFVFIEDTVR